MEFEPLLAVSAIIALVQAVVAYISASAVATAIVKGLIVAGLSILAQSLRPKPKVGGALQDSGANFMIRQPAYPRRILLGETRVGGIWAYANTTGSKNQFLHLVLLIGEGPIEGLETIYFGEEIVTFDAVTGDCLTDPYVGFAKLFFHDGSQTTAHADLIANDSNWTADHKLLGIANCYMRFEHDSEVWDSGLPEVLFHVKGSNDVVLGRTGEIGYTNNSSDVWNHYLTKHTMGPSIPIEKIDSIFQQEAADVCDGVVTNKDDSTEVRYSTNGFFLTDTEPEDIAGDLVEAMAGWQIYVNGTFRVYAGHHIPATFEITEDMVIDDVRVKNKLPRADRVNTVKGRFRSPDNDWQNSDFPTQTDAEFVEQDGEVHIGDLELPFTISVSAAQRLGRILLHRKRLQKRVTLTTNFRAFRAQAGENILLTLSEMGYVQKMFHVDQVSLGVFNEVPALVFELIETDSFIYDYIPAIHETTPDVVPSINAGGADFALTATPSEAPDVNAAQFRSGLGQRLDAPDGAGFSFVDSGDFTIAVWFRDTGSTDNNATIFAQGDAGLPAGSLFSINSTDAAGAAELSFSVRNSVGTLETAVSLLLDPSDNNWNLVFLVYDDTAKDLTLWAKEAGDVSIIAAITSAPFTDIAASSALDFTVGAANDTGADFIGEIGPIAMWSDDKAAIGGFFEDYFDQGTRVATYKRYSELSAAELTNLEHFWNMNDKTGAREDSQGSDDFGDTGTTGVGSIEGPVNWPITVVLDTPNEAADIYYTKNIVARNIGRSDIDSKLNDWFDIDIDEYLEDETVLTMAESSKLMARAFDDESSSNLVAKYYGFDYTILGFPDTVLLWLDAGIGVSLDGSGNVEHWYDKSGQNDHAFQTTSGNRPTWVADSGNGFPAIRFDGVDDYLDVPQSVSGSVDRMIFLVFKSSLISSKGDYENIIYDGQGGASPGTGEMWALGLERDVRMTATPSGSYRKFNSDLDGSRYHVVALGVRNNGEIEDGSVLRITSKFKKQTKDSQTNSVFSTAVTTNATIGKSKAIAGSEFEGDLLEMIILDDLPATANGQSIAQYLAYKYGAA